MFTCRQHGTLMRELALGRLDNESTLLAREARRSCPTCASEWQQVIQDHADTIDAAVSRAFADFQAPASRRWAAWQPIAAAAVLALAAGLVLRPADPALEEANSPPTGAVLTQESFEIRTLEDIDLSGLSLTVVDTDTVPAADSIFEASQETGDLAGWSSNS